MTRVYKNNYKVPNAEPKSPDYPPTGKIELERSFCTYCVPVQLPDINDPNATFTGKPGTYTLGGL
jgi:hypothetical protein